MYLWRRFIIKKKINLGTFCITDLTLNLPEVFFIFNEKNFRKSFMVYFPPKCLFFVYLTDILIMYQIVICCSENYLKVEWATLENLDFIKTYNVIFSEIRLPFNDHIYQIRGNLLLWRSQLSRALPSWEIIHVNITVPLEIKRIS